jgi:hypothetical protein
MSHGGIEEQSREIGGVASQWNPAFGGGSGVEGNLASEWHPGLGGPGDPERYGYPVAEIVENSLNVLARCLSLPLVFSRSP